MNGLPLWKEANRSADWPGCSPEASARPSADGPGLSKGHNVTNPSPKRPDYRFESWEGAGLFRVVTPYQGDPKPPDEGRRGTVKGYSPKARSRAKQFLAKIPDVEIVKAFMVTLTYPGNDCPEAIPAPEDWKTYKGHLRKFGQNMKRRFGAAAVWVLEFQRRGAPHYHLLVFGIDAARLIELRRWIAKEWNRIVGGDAAHLKAGTQCDLARSPHGARNYLAKYMTKGDQSLEGAEVGRYWGKVNREAIPLAEERVEELTPAQAVIASRVARKLAEKRQWETAWRRLIKSTRAMCHQHFKTNILDALSDQTIRALIEEGHRRGRFDLKWIPSWVWGGWLAEMPRVSFLGAVMLAMGGRWKMPRRPRSRNNCTRNLYCNATAFRESLTKHPKWNETENEEEQENTGRGLRSLWNQSSGQSAETATAPSGDSERILDRDPASRSAGEGGDEYLPFPLCEGTPRAGGGRTMDGEDSGHGFPMGGHRKDVLLAHPRRGSGGRPVRVYALDPSRCFERDPF